MSHGLNLYDSSGNLSISITDRITQFYTSGSGSVSAYTNYNDITVSGISVGSSFVFTDSVYISSIIIANDTIRLYKSPLNYTQTLSCTYYVYRF